jgi:SAM-dependent methyltransferase
MENASDYPFSEFYGFDIAPLFPSLILPPNCHFLLHDINNGPLPYPDDFFDFVFQRNMSMSISQERWVHLVNELVRVTKPGGYVELVEWDLEIKRRSAACEDWNDKLMFFLRSRGLVPRICLNLESLLHGSGLIEVDKRHFSCPYGEWGHAIGKQSSTSWLEATMAAKPVLGTSLGIPSDDYDGTLNTIVADFDRYRTFTDIYTVFGRKPRPLEIRDWLEWREKVTGKRAEIKDWTEWRRRMRGFGGGKENQMNGIPRLEGVGEEKEG